MDIPPPKQNLKQRISNGLKLSKVLSQPFLAGDSKRENELRQIAQELKVFCKVLRKGERYDVMLMDSTREMELI